MFQMKELYTKIVEQRSVEGLGNIKVKILYSYNPDPEYGGCKVEYSVADGANIFKRDYKIGLADISHLADEDKYHFVVNKGLKLFLHSLANFENGYR
ncbi:MAG: hypothetical protein GX660_19130 [Clostridiaceae bacterium]|mgnify:CR=1 FL=1|nr:hypothetical protein [Clostridiaceae bacterium]